MIDLEAECLSLAEVALQDSVLVGRDAILDARQAAPTLEDYTRAFEALVAEGLPMTEVAFKMVVTDWPTTRTQVGEINRGRSAFIRNRR